MKVKNPFNVLSKFKLKTPAGVFSQAQKPLTRPEAFMINSSRSVRCVMCKKHTAFDSPAVKVNNEGKVGHFYCQTCFEKKWGAEELTKVKY